MRIEIILVIIVLCFLNTIQAQQCTDCNNPDQTGGSYSSKIGFNNTALGDYSFSGGNNCEANARRSFSFGNYTTTGSNATGAIVLGSNVDVFAPYSFVFGASRPDQHLYNALEETMMIGFNSSKPTLFISRSPSPLPGNTIYDRTGKVAIGNMTNPQAKLHIYSDDNENATLFLQPSNWMQYTPEIWFGNMANKISARFNTGMIYSTGRYHSFQDGNVGIGTDIPEYTLDVVGDINLSGDLLVHGLPLKSPWELERSNVYYLDGNVGIGTINPMSKLEVMGQVSIGYNVAGLEQNNLIVEGSVGIGTFHPSAKLDVDGKIKTTGFQLLNGNLNGNILQCDNDGNAVWVDPNVINDGDWTMLANNLYVEAGRFVGIGTTTPTQQLDVRGNIKISGNIYGGHDNWESLKLFAGTNENDGAYMIMNSNENQTASLKLYARGTDGRIEFHNHERQIMSVRGDGSVRIGDPANQSSLMVHGEIKAKIVRVTTDIPWYDFVFDEGYNLMPLTDLEEFIKKNHHLPDMPTEDEVHEEGLNLAEMNALLLKKVEELTLYVIELKKENEGIKGVINNLKNN